MRAAAPVIFIKLDSNQRSLVSEVTTPNFCGFVTYHFWEKLAHAVVSRCLQYRLLRTVCVTCLRMSRDTNSLLRKQSRRPHAKRIGDIVWESNPSISLCETERDKQTNKSESDNTWLRVHTVSDWYEFMQYFMGVPHCWVCIVGCESRLAVKLRLLKRENLRGRVTI